MMNDREDDYTAQEDSEYHFSDDDASYEVEPEGQKSEPTPEVPVSNRNKVMDWLANSRRLIISLGVFVFLIFVVYRMITGTENTPTTEIVPMSTATTPTPVTNATIPANAPSATNALPTGNTDNNVTPALPVNNKPAAALAPSTPANQATPAAALPAHNAAMAPINNAPLQNQAPISAIPTNSSTTAAPNTVQQPVTSNVLPTADTVPQQPLVQPVAGMPNVIPVTTNNQSGYYQQTSVPPNSAASHTSVLNSLDAQVKMIEAQNQRLLAQLNANYNQRLDDFYAQSKSIEGQIQTLATRVASMESQLNQIYQAVQEKEANKPVVSQPQPPIPEKSPANSKIPYTVQAIIPGRAWLKSDSGDTVTVSEGDILKDAGRVVKIDPYDGIVQINTGNTVVSLAYGVNGN